MFFANVLLLAIYFICILDYRNDVRQKQIQAFFYSSSKWVTKQQWQLETSTTHLMAQERLPNSAVVIQEVL